MTCDEIQSLLLQSDDLSAVDRVVGDEPHVAGCASCSELAGKLRRLEEAVRSLPDPLDSTAARLRFEHRYAAVIHGRRSRFRFLPWAAAAVVLLAVGGALAIHHHFDTENRAVAASEAIDRAVDFNLTLGRSDSDAERQQLYAQGSANLQQTAGTDDRSEFADNLIRGAKVLTETHDPLAQADHFTSVADQLVTRMGTTARKNPKALNRLRQDYFNVMSQGIHRNLDIAAASATSTAEYRHRLQKIIQRNQQLQTKLRATLKDNPDQAQVRKQLDQVDRRLHRLEQRAVAATQPGAIIPKKNPIR